METPLKPAGDASMASPEADTIPATQPDPEQFQMTPAKQLFATPGKTSQGQCADCINL